VNALVLPEASRRFLTTSWTQVRQAGVGGEESRVAWSSLCELYWYPVYAHVRRRGLRAEDAEDATQSFFAWLLEANIIARADQARGRFRTFLLTAMDQFLIRRHEYESAAKRRPDRPMFSLSIDAAERRYASEPATSSSIERQFDRAWALAVLDRSMERLGDEWRDGGKAARFEALRPFVAGDESAAVPSVATRLGLSEGAVRVAVHRLRARFAALLRDEVGRTLDGEADIDDELRHLRESLMG
jgi:DNA-directed RNA polymerase specialized sigma24 family protein